ncbi:MAG TPA: V-type ATPase subunit [Steroidobacteraceae bacterium]|nr:V-type ATPase subunit [Steroidobacteraceae bacterium]
MSDRHEAYLHARVSVMQTRLLKPEQIEALLEAPDEGRDNIASGARVHDLLLAGTSAPPYALEQRIHSSVLDDCLILARPLRGPERDFLLHWVHRLELSNLKAILRGKLTGRAMQDIRADLQDAGAFVSLPVEQMLRTEDFSELLRLLEATPYADIARQARAAFDTEHDLFAVDATVDRRYFNGLLSRSLPLQERQGPLFAALVASIIDRVNLVWLLRYRFVYMLPPAQTFYLLLPTHHSMLTSARLAALVKLESLAEVLDALPAPLRAQLEGQSDTFGVTQRMERRTYEAGRQVLQHAPHALARAFAYLVMREFDLRKVRAIAKWRQLQMAPEVIRYSLGLAPAH